MWAVVVAMLAFGIALTLIYYLAPSSSAALFPFTGTSMGGNMVLFFSILLIVVGIVVILAGLGLFRRIEKMVVAAAGGVGTAIGMAMLLLPIPGARIVGAGSITLGLTTCIRSFARPLSRTFGILTVILGILMIIIGIAALILLA
jgi:hypothetical protein